MKEIRPTWVAIAAILALTTFTISPASAQDSKCPCLKKPAPRVRVVTRTIHEPAAAPSAADNINTNTITLPPADHTAENQLIDLVRKNQEFLQDLATKKESAPDDQRTTPTAPAAGQHQAVAPPKGRRFAPQNSIEESMYFIAGDIHSLRNWYRAGVIAQFGMAFGVNWAAFHPASINQSTAVSVVALPQFRAPASLLRLAPGTSLIE